MASRSGTPSARAAATADANTSSARETVSRADSRASLAGIGATNLDVAKSRGTRAVARAHHLLGLALAAIRRAPKRPVLGARDGSAGIPELGADAAITGIFQHADTLAVADLPSNLASELEVVSFVVDRPAFVGLHVNPVVSIEHFFQRLYAGLKAYIGHANERNPCPTVGPHGAVRALLTHSR